MTELPLAHLTVLDLTLHRAGPTCARQFADWGAHVIKIEAAGGAKGDAIGSSRRRPGLSEPASQQARDDAQPQER